MTLPGVQSPFGWTRERGKKTTFNQRVSSSNFRKHRTPYCQLPCCKVLQCRVQLTLQCRPFEVLSETEFEFTIRLSSIKSRLDVIIGLRNNAVQGTSNETSFLVWFHSLLKLAFYTFPELSIDQSALRISRHFGTFPKFDSDAKCWSLTGHRFWQGAKSDVLPR